MSRLISVLCDDKLVGMSGRSLRMVMLLSSSSSSSSDDDDESSGAKKMSLFCRSFLYFWIVGMRRSVLPACGSAAP